MLHEGCVSEGLLALVRKLEKVTASLVKKTITDAIRKYNETQINNNFFR